MHGTLTNTLHHSQLASIATIQIRLLNIPSPVYSDLLAKSLKTLVRSVMQDAAADDERAAPDAILAIEATSVYTASPASELSWASIAGLGRRGHSASGGRRRCRRTRLLRAWMIEVAPAAPSPDL